MNIEDKVSLHSIIGGMTNDYYDFFCKECGSHINCVDFYCLDIVGVQLVSKCPNCGLTSIFKMKTSIPLGPIQMVTTFCKDRVNFGYKIYDQRKLKSYKKKIENKISER